jgi:glycosyltransferase involved in cell wall biosynthesis
MRILWLPHQDWQFIRKGQREYRLAQRIAHRHDVHFLTWHKPRRDLGSLVRALRTEHWRDAGFAVHQARRVPNFLGRRVHEASGRGLKVNEWLCQRTLRRVVERERIDLVLCGISHQAVGLPPDDLPIPLVFDYLDYKAERWPGVEADYLARADAVLCTSRVLVERVEARHPYTYYLPNGVDLEAAKAADGGRVRRLYDLDGAKVVSLIGLTASKRPFYIDAVAASARRVPGVRLLLVGDEGELGRAMRRRAAELGLPTVVTGPVPPSEVADYFAASDVGLYPGDQTAYFDAASPLKVLEYTAARKPVVATDLEELRNWAFPNVRLAPPTAEAFAQEIVQAIEQPHRYPDLADFSWSALAERLLAILDEVAARGKRRGRDSSR